MHEMAITRSMLDLVLDTAARAKASQVTRITLAIGELSGVVDRAVVANFEWMKRGTPAAGAILEIRNVPSCARCRHCGREYAPDDFWWTCPGCRANEFEVIAGREMSLESIEVN
jgi:hydrogenase nickel incorporation protein HypA/HybF